MIYSLCKTICYTLLGFHATGRSIPRFPAPGDNCTIFKVTNRHSYVEHRTGKEHPLAHGGDDRQEASVSTFPGKGNAGLGEPRILCMF